MCLTALLLQPKEFMPSVIVINEPELGLHPSAISKLDGMIKIASKNAQLILATQSPNFVDNFNLDDITIVERNSSDGGSNFKKLDKVFQDMIKLNDLLMSITWMHSGAFSPTGAVPSHANTLRAMDSAVGLGFRISLNFCYTSQTQYPNK